jgi:single-strand DNA-binding protein
MAGDTPITIVGNLTGDVELRYTPQGQPVASFRVASTPRTFDRQANEWRDGDPLFLACNVWRQAAEKPVRAWPKGCASSSTEGSASAHTKPRTAGNAPSTRSR